MPFYKKTTIAIKFAICGLFGSKIGPILFYFSILNFSNITKLFSAIIDIDK